MKRQAPKRFEQLPKAQVTDVQLRAEGGLIVALKIEPGADIQNGSGSLLWKTPECLEAISGQVALSTRNHAALSTSTAEVADFGTGEVRYLSGEWSPYHVWMISLPIWRWDRQVFEAGDGIAEKCLPEAAPPYPAARQ